MFHSTHPGVGFYGRRALEQFGAMSAYKINNGHLRRRKVIQLVQTADLKDGQMENKRSDCYTTSEIQSLLLRRRPLLGL
ncbi:hypothetical protein ZHAS_00014322 [Anopheles sinensis]|uniref:Uncharacterized protein n=1 Tax=Anopheles sinensis TaxID=74873 RepID=A0A084W7Y6_ANOSI|nr:hypothetical protein ZHAS_00014322 [Anopheles sinensis]